MSNKKQNLESLKTELAAANATWVAAENHLTALSEAELKLMLGYTPGPGEPSLLEREKLALANFEAFKVSKGAFGYPASYDWRNVSGNNYITSVKNQASCGSCVAFGTIATVEGTLRVLRGNPNLAVDFSEAHLFYCLAGSEGRTCGGATGGWWPDYAMNKFRDVGVIPESAYPYTAGDQACGAPAGWQNMVTKISGYHAITNAADMKTWLSTRGPLSACFTVYNDFFSYSAGVYRHVSGALAGGHCVCIVGYSDVDQCWIAKNSWTTGWGEAGFFRIGYGQCGIDSTMYAVDGVIETGWNNNIHVQGLWSNESDRNVYVYLETLGWRKISPDNDNIVINLLSLFADAKASNRTVNVYLENSIIKQVYSL